MKQHMLDIQSVFWQKVTIINCLRERTIKIFLMAQHQQEALTSLL